MIDGDARLQEILEEHFDARWGAPYWLRTLPNLSFDPLTDIKRVADLNRFGPMPVDHLTALPIQDFIPRHYHSRLHDFILSETSGTTGPPKRTAYLKDEFRLAFVEPFLAAAASLNFPQNRNWLYIGPSGPHAIGKAARECAVAMGSIDPFTVDFDPRWAQKLSVGSMARNRYLDHVMRQAESVLQTQDISVIFATPPVLAELGERLARAQREAIAGIHLGGVAADQAFWKSLTTDWFPHAVAMAGYGNSLAGMCPQLFHEPGEPPSYFPHGNRLFLDIDSPDQNGRGRVVFHRLDHSCFLPNVYERDEAEATGRAPTSGFQWFGIRDPRPPISAETTVKELLY